MIVRPHARLAVVLAIAVLACAPRGTVDQLGEPIIDRGNPDGPAELAWECAFAPATFGESRWRPGTP
jgi:hypothetical protein